MRSGLYRSEKLRRANTFLLSPSMFQVIDLNFVDASEKSELSEVGSLNVHQDVLQHGKVLH